MNIENWTGWKLDEVQAALAADESTCAVPLRLIETAAPPRKNRTPQEQAERLGAWRVLRARLANEAIELVVAREQLVD